MWHFKNKECLGCLRTSWSRKFAVLLNYSAQTWRDQDGIHFLRKIKLNSQSFYMRFFLRLKFSRASRTRQFASPVRKLSAKMRMSLLVFIFALFLSIYIQDDSGGICTTLGNDSMSDSKQKSSYEHGSDFERLRSYDRLKLGIEGIDYWQWTEENNKPA